MIFGEAINFVELLPRYIGAFGSIGLLFTAWIQATKARSEARSRATEAYIEKIFSDVQVKKNRDRFREVMIQVEDIGKVDLSSSQGETIIAELNFYETASMMVIRKSYDQDLIVRAIGASFIRDWKKLQPFIKNMRKHHAYVWRHCDEFLPRAEKMHKSQIAQWAKSKTMK